MKRVLIIFFLFSSGVCFAQSLKGSVSGEYFKDYFEYLNLTPEQKRIILKISEEENFVMRPLALDVRSKEAGLEHLYNLKCDFFDKACKTLLKEDIENLEAEKKEALRKIEVKKNYYSIRYTNVLNREQNLKLTKMLEFEAKKQKVLKEREERQKKQNRIDKLKFWKSPALHSKFNVFKK